LIALIINAHSTRRGVRTFVPGTVILDATGLELDIDRKTSLFRDRSELRRAVKQRPDVGRVTAHRHARRRIDLLFTMSDNNALPVRY